MHALLEEFLDKWVWPTMPGAPGAEFRLKITRERCIKGWGLNLARTLADIEEELKTNDEAWKKAHALRGSMKINEAWHQANRMPPNSSMDERVSWHQAHVALDLVGIAKARDGIERDHESDGRHGPDAGHCVNTVTSGLAAGAPEVRF